MRVEIVATGRAKAAPAAGLYADYAERISRIGPGLGIASLTLTELSEGKGADAATRRRQEAQAMLGAVDRTATMLLLDEGGRNLTSQEFAAWIAAERDGGTKVLSCLVGGPDGVDASVRRRADLSLALGRMTWPHLLARALLVEQIYRSLTIIGRHPYHRA